MHGDLRPRGTNQSILPSREISDLTKDPFSECMKCGFPLSGITKPAKAMDDLSIVLNCGHVLCNSCVHLNDFTTLNRGRPLHCQHDFQCSICGEMSPPLTIPNCVRICNRRYSRILDEDDQKCSCEICKDGLKDNRGFRLNNIAYCGLHPDTPVQSFCIQCGKHLCQKCFTQTTDQFNGIDHSITDISRSNPKLEDALLHGSVIHGNLKSLEDEAKKSAAVFNEKAENLKNTLGCYFGAIINGAIGRYVQLHAAISSEQINVDQMMESVQKGVKEAKRRIEVSKEMDEISRSKLLMPENFVSDSYKMSAQKIFREAVVLHNKTITDVRSLKTHNIKLHTRKSPEEVAKSVTNIFSDYVVTNSCNMQAYHLDEFVQLVKPTGQPIIKIDEKHIKLAEKDISTSADAIKISDDGFSKYETALMACGMGPKGQPLRVHQSLLARKTRETVIPMRNEPSVVVADEDSGSPTVSMHPVNINTSMKTANHSAALPETPCIVQHAVDKAKKQELLLQMIRGASNEEDRSQLVGMPPLNQPKPVFPTFSRMHQRKSTAPQPSIPFIVSRIEQEKAAHLKEKSIEAEKAKKACNNRNMTEHGTPLVHKGNTSVHISYSKMPPKQAEQQRPSTSTPGTSSSGKIPFTLDAVPTRTPSMSMTRDPELAVMQYLGRGLSDAEKAQLSRSITESHQRQQAEFQRKLASNSTKKSRISFQNLIPRMKTPPSNSSPATSRPDMSNQPTNLRDLILQPGIGAVANPRPNAKYASTEALAINKHLMTVLTNSKEFLELPAKYQVSAIKAAQFMTKDEENKKKSIHENELKKLEEIHEAKLKITIEKLYNLYNEHQGKLQQSQDPQTSAPEPSRPTQIITNSHQNGGQKERSDVIPVPQVKVVECKMFHPPNVAQVKPFDKVVKEEVLSDGEDVKPNISGLKEELRRAKERKEEAANQKSQSERSTMSPQQDLNANQSLKIVLSRESGEASPTSSKVNGNGTVAPAIPERADGRLILRIPRPAAIAPPPEVKTPPTITIEENVNTDEEANTTEVISEVKPELNDELSGEAVGTNGYESDNESTRSLDEDGTHSWCYVCNDDRQDLPDEEKGICLTCPRVFHQVCTIPRMRVPWSEDENWQCLFCKPISPESDEKSNDSSLMTPRNRTLCQKVLLQCFSTRKSSYLNRSYVDTKKTLQVVAERLEPDSPESFETVDQFIEAVNDVLKNSSTHNAPNSEKGQGTKKVWKIFRKAVGKYIPDYLKDVWLYVSLYAGNPTKRRSSTNKSTPSAKRRR